MREQIVAQAAHIVAPAESVGDGDGMAKIASFHQFQVLLVLSRSARGHFVEPLAGVALVGVVCSKAVEGVEESGRVRSRQGWHKATHGKGVDHRIVEI